MDEVREQWAYRVVSRQSEQAYREGWTDAQWLVNEVVTALLRDPETRDLANEIHERVWRTLRDSAEKFREEFADRTRRVWES